MAFVSVAFNVTRAAVVDHAEPETTLRILSETMEVGLSLYFPNPIAAREWLAQASAAVSGFIPQEDQ